MTLPCNISWVGSTIIAQFESIVSLNNDETAIVFGRETITYKALNENANRLATYLQPLDVSAGAAVGVCLERSIDSVITILAILKCGASYVPLDPAYPHGRLHYMLDNSGSRLVVTHSTLSSVFTGDWDNASSPLRIIQLDQLSGEIAQCDSGNLQPYDNLDLAAYIIHTSGSTGQPKGVVMNHRAVANLIEWQLGSSQTNAGTRTGQFSPLSFDVSFQEIFSTLCSGGELVIVPEEQRRDPFALLDMLHEERIQRLFMPFVALQQLTESAVVKKSYPLNLVEIITAGEQLVITDAIRAFFSNMPDCALYNHYGPSETHVVTSHKMVGPPCDWPRLPPIGRAIQDVQLYILDESQNQVGAGESGELYIGGSCLADGYVNKPNLTAERFIDTLASVGNERVYRTGDIARFTDDGAVECLGRIDQQVKIRGHRIEPGEIESILSMHPDVSQVAVTASKQSNGEQVLTACIVPTSADVNSGLSGNDREAMSKDMASYVGHKLPSYMVPSHFRFLAEFPLTPSGKLDRKSLNQNDIAPPASEPTGDTTELSLEDLILTYWQFILEAPGLKMLDNVFHHGATSLSVPIIQRKLLADRGLLVPATAIFQYPSPLALAQFLQSRAVRDTEIHITPKKNIRRPDLLTALRNKRTGSTDKAHSV